MNLNFDDIKYFSEVAKTQNLSRAAERIGISQPSLSAAMKRLENLLGVDLLIRSRSGVQLTQSGQIFYKNSISLLNNWESLKLSVHEKENNICGSYSLGCHPSVATYTLPAFLPMLLSEFPKLDIALKHGLSRHITEQVISFNIDFGIVVNPVHHPDLIIKKLCQDEIKFWIAKKATTSTAQTLILDSNLTQTQELLKKIKKSKFVFKKYIETSNLEVLASLTKAGAGVGILPQRVALQNAEGFIKVLDKSLPTYKDQICLIYRYDNQKTPGSKAFIKKITEAFK